jgi:hypothetical protein
MVRPIGPQDCRRELDAAGPSAPSGRAREAGRRDGLFRSAVAGKRSDTADRFPKL